MSKPEREIVSLGVSLESFRDRQELLAQRVALKNLVDVEYFFNDNLYRVTLEDAVKAHSGERVKERIEDLVQDFERDTQRLLEKEAFIKEEIEEEKNSAKTASEINL